jgi:hypothetical protein
VIRDSHGHRLAEASPRRLPASAPGSGAEVQRWRCAGVSACRGRPSRNGALPQGAAPAGGAAIGCIIARQRKGTNHEDAPSHRLGARPRGRCCARRYRCPSRRGRGAAARTAGSRPARTACRLRARRTRCPSRLRQGACFLWLPFLDTYRTMCLAPDPPFRRVLEEVRASVQHEFRATPAGCASV